MRDRLSQRSESRRETAANGRRCPSRYQDCVLGQVCVRPIRTVGCALTLIGGHGRPDNDDHFEYRHVILPKQLLKMLPRKCVYSRDIAASCA